jgi:hypothetical protein
VSLHLLRGSSLRSRSYPRYPRTLIPLLDSKFIIIVEIFAIQILQDFDVMVVLHCEGAQYFRFLYKIEAIIFNKQKAS